MPKPNTRDAMKRFRAGKAGFTDKAHLKAKGLIPRADGTKRKSPQYESADTRELTNLLNKRTPLTPAEQKRKAELEKKLGVNEELKVGDMVRYIGPERTGLKKGKIGSVVNKTSSGYQVDGMMMRSGVRHKESDLQKITKEDAPANATGTAVAGTGDDSSTVVVRRKKDKEKMKDRLLRRFKIKETIDRLVPAIEPPTDEVRERVDQLKELAKGDIEKAISIANKMGGDMTGAVAQIEKIKVGLSRNPMVQAALRQANEGFASAAQRRAAFASGYKAKGKKGKKSKKEDLEKDDEAPVKTVIKGLKKAVATHTKQAKSLEKQISDETELEENKSSELINLYQIKNKTPDIKARIAQLEKELKVMKREGLEESNVRFGLNKKIIQTLQDKLRKEGGAAGFDDLKKAARSIGYNLTPQALRNTPGIKQHRDGDYILTAGPPIELMLTYGKPGEKVKTYYTKFMQDLQNKASELRRKGFVVDKMGRKQPMSQLRDRIPEELEKDDEGPLKTVIKGLKKASGLHAKQAKSLEKQISDETELEEDMDRQPQDKDVKKVKGTQPKKYYKTLPKGLKKKRADFFSKQKYKKSDDDDDYKPAPGDKGAKTKPSIHTKKFKKLFGEIKDLNEKIKGLENKAKKTGMPYGILKKVYDRGMAAWKGGHRPGTTQQQWAFARVNSFVTKSSGTWGGADKDLAKKVRAAKK